jgi:hypothetical protein
MNTTTSTDLPGFVLRALHSGWTDWLLMSPPEISQAMAERCAGMAFNRFCLALSAHRLAVTQRVDDQEQLFIGVCVPTSDGNPWQLFELPASHTGMSLEFLMSLSLHRIDERLTEMLESSDE